MIGLERQLRQARIGGNCFNCHEPMQVYRADKDTCSAKCRKAKSRYLTGVAKDAAAAAAAAKQREKERRAEARPAKKKKKKPAKKPAKKKT